MILSVLALVVFNAAVVASCLSCMVMVFSLAVDMSVVLLALVMGASASRDHM